MRYHFIRRHIEKESVKLKLIKSENNTSDMFTKNLRHKLSWKHTYIIVSHQKLGFFSVQCSFSRPNINLFEYQIRRTTLINPIPLIPLFLLKSFTSFLKTHFLPSAVIANAVTASVSGQVSYVRIVSGI